jgi:hypothetical protein
VQFGASGGLAVWQADGQTLGLRPVQLDGTASGPASTARVGDDRAIEHLVPFDGGYVLLLGGHEWKRSRWWALATDAAGHVLGSPKELDLEHRYVQDTQPLGGRSVAVLGTRALMVPDDKESLPGRWDTLTVGADGSIEEKASDLAFKSPLVRLLDNALRADVGGHGGWVIARGGEPDSDVVADGVLTRVPKESVPPLAPDAVDWVLAFDPLQLTRIAGGAQVGQPTRIVLADGQVDVLVHLEWSGSRYVVPYVRESGSHRTAALVTLDCR